jgi:hypothetical protein
MMKPTNGIFDVGELMFDVGITRCRDLSQLVIHDSWVEAFRRDQASEVGN